MLYLVSTPIGNLADITFRAIETLKSVDYILCEDTRHSLILLHHYSISKPLKSYHKFNESARENELIEDLLAGKNIALISDAGTPGISDPGTQLVKECLDNNIQVVSIPGPCAAVAALSSSGFDSTRFQFSGFLPRKTGAIKTALQEILTYPATTICYESPNRLIQLLTTIHELAPDRQLCVCRELTKKFEEVRRGNAKDLIHHWKDRTIKGEIVMLISGAPQKLENWEELAPQEHVQMMQDNYGLTKAEAIKMVAELRGVPKREIYQQVHVDKSLDSSIDSSKE